VDTAEITLFKILMFVPAVILAVDKLLADTLVAVTSPNTVIPSENIEEDCNEFALNVSADNVPILPNEEFNVPVLLIEDVVILLLDKFTKDTLVASNLSTLRLLKFMWDVFTVWALNIIASTSPTSNFDTDAFTMSKLDMLKKLDDNPPIGILNIL
jgi:hypothetical protein